jgi:hypothetical protein
LKWKRHFASLAEDGRHWDFANIYDDLAGMLRLFRDPWLDEEEEQRLGNLRLRISDFWENTLSEDQRAHLNVECYIKYDDIIEIDEKGDDIAECPHVFVSLKNGAPLRGIYRGEIIVPSKLLPDNTLSETRRLVDPHLSDRINIFPSEFCKAIS